MKQQAIASGRTELSRWLRLIQAEYREMPGLHLTKKQMQRLWGFDNETCDAVLAELEDVSFLRRTPKDAYVRTDFDS